MKKVIPVLLFIGFIGYSCGLTGSETTPPSAGLYIINASPDAPAVDVALNNNIIASGYPYGKDSGYFLAFPGSYEFKLSQTGATIDLTNELISFSAGKYYSFFLVDSFSKRKTLLIEDELTADTFSYAKIRLFDFCPNSPTFKAVFASTNNDTLSFSVRYFNDQGTNSGYTNFSAVPAGSYNLSLYTTDSTSQLIKNFGNISFSIGKYYTVYLKGLFDNNITPFDTAVIRH